MSEASCLFCDIVKGTAPATIVVEEGDFIVIKNKYPKAPIHVLVVDKHHREKAQTLAGNFPGYWDQVFSVIFRAVGVLGLDKTGYKLVNNGAGYNHFSHEHFHILGGSDKEPGGET